MTARDIIDVILKKRVVLEGGQVQRNTKRETVKDEYLI